MSSSADISTGVQATPIFLGISTKAFKHGLHLDLFQLGPQVFLPVYPYHLQYLTMLLAIPRDVSRMSEGWRIVFRDEARPEHSAHVDVSVFRGEPIESVPQENVQKLMQYDAPIGGRDAIPEKVCFLACDGAAATLVAIQCPPLLLTAPSIVQVEWHAADQVTKLARVPFGFVRHAPITRDEAHALLSNPHQMRTIKAVLSCTACGDSLNMYETIDESNEPEASDGIRLQSAPDSWKCRCASATIATKWLKESAPYFFRTNPRQLDSSLDLRANFQNIRLHEVARKLRQLINDLPVEEELQRFLQTNHVCWSFLSPKKILHKPRVLTHCTADFGVVSVKRILYLIEIEKPQTSLLRRDMGRHSEVGRAFDQIAQWRRVVKSNFRTLLSELELREDEVSRVQYIVVAGVDTEEAAAIREELPENTDFLTFEELAANLLVMHSQISVL